MSKTTNCIYTASFDIFLFFIISNPLYKYRRLQNDIKFYSVENIFDIKEIFHQ